MPFKNCYLVPLFQGILYPVTFITTYILAAIVNKDVPPIFPYVSDTGAWSIERCIFSFMIGIGAILMVSITYIRYRQVKEILETHKEQEFKSSLNFINKYSMYLSFFGAVGLFLLACFQVQPFLVVHLIGAGSAFVLGWIYIIIQTYVSFKIYPFLGNFGLNIFRAVLCVIVSGSLFMCGLFGLMGYLQFEGDDITQWTESSGGYGFHLISVINEWFLVFGVVLYMTLYTGEFKSVVLYKPKIEVMIV